MAEMNSFAGNPSSSRWVVTNPTPGIIRHSVRSNKKSQLLSEAASLVPSAQDLIDRLSKHALSPGDQNFFQTILGGHMTDYVGKYTDNPYFAFSREGKEKVKTMQSIVNNSLLNEAALAFDKSAKTAEIAQHERNENNFNVVGGSISVYDQNTGKIKRVLPDHLTASMIPMTFADELAERTRKGFFDQDNGRVEDPISYNQISHKEVVDGINAITSGLGSNEWNDFSRQLTDVNSRVGVKYKSNASQIKTALNSIFSKYGSTLPENYMDTLLATEYANQYAQKKSIDRDEAYQNVARKIQDIVIKKSDDSRIMEESPLSKAQGTASTQMAQVGPLQSIFLNNGNKSAEKIIGVDGKQYAVSATQIDPMIFGQNFVDKDGVKERVLPLNMNPIFKNVMQEPGAKLKTLDGYDVNPAYAIPLPDSSVITYQDPASGKFFVEFDVLATDNYGGDFAKSKDNIRKATDEEYRYWTSIGEHAAAAYDKNKTLSPFYGTEDMKWYKPDTQYKVRVRTEYDTDASLKAGYHEENKLYIPRDAVTIGSPKTQDGGSNRTLTIPY